MNKRMKDPKGDLRFVHKSTRVYDFWSLKLTAMTYRRQAGRKDAKKSNRSLPLACLPQVGLSVLASCLSTGGLCVSASLRPPRRIFSLLFTQSLPTARQGTETCPPR